MGRQLEMLILRDGTLMERGKIHTIMKQILHLGETDIMTFYQFLGLATGSRRQLSPGNLLHEQLSRTTLLDEDGRVPEEVRRVFHSSIEGSYPDFRLIWPTKD